MSDTDGDGIVDDFSGAASADAAPVSSQAAEPVAKLRGCGVFIFDHAGRLFMMQRGPASRDEQYKWEVPGGAVEEGETYEQAVRREVLEEVGVEVVVDRRIARYEELIGSNGDSWEAETFIGTIEGQPAIQEPHKCVGIGWFTREEVLALNRASYIDKDLEHLGWL